MHLQEIPSSSVGGWLLSGIFCPGKNIRILKMFAKCMLAYQLFPQELPSILRPDFFLLHEKSVEKNVAKTMIFLTLVLFSSLQ